MVDGFGFCGIEGVFRRSCESTMEVLRKNADIIITILEVLLYDPLYLWTLSEERKHKIQSEDRSQALNSRFVTDSAAETENKNTERNNTAARELRRLRCKLAGIQEGRASGYTMTVPGHVSQLISFAIDVNSLSKLYPGWQPYL
jgi:ataxia telangiectasia mutated family protein